MKRNSLLLLLAMLIFLPLTSNAQVGKLLKKKLQEATQSVTDEKKEDKENANPGKGLMGLLGGGDAAYDQSYDFTGRIILEMTAYDDDGAAESVIDYYSYFNESTGNAAVEVKPVSGEAAQSGMSVMTMVFDQKNQSAVMLTAQGGQKTAIITSIDIDEEAEETTVEDSELPDYQKTGRKRKISGYNCEEYKYADGETSTSMWITNDLKFKVDRKQMQQAGVPAWYGGKDGSGMMIEMESFENDRLLMKMLVKDIDMKFNKAVTVDGYMIMNVGGEGK